VKGYAGWRSASDLKERCRCIHKTAEDAKVAQRLQNLVFEWIHLCTRRPYRSLLVVGLGENNRHCIVTYEVYGHSGLSFGWLAI
jgi:hypothetical protein